MKQSQAACLQLYVHGTTLLCKAGCTYLVSHVIWGLLTPEMQWQCSGKNTMFQGALICAAMHVVLGLYAFVRKL